MSYSDYLDSKPLPKPNRPNNSRRTLSATALSPSEQTSRNSSLWAQDYIDAETEVGDSIEGPITPPPACATTSRPYPRSVPLSEVEEQAIPRQPRSHQRSLTSLLPTFKLPKRGDSRTPERSPKKEKTQREVDEDFFMPTLTGDRDGIVRVEQKNNGGLSGWFTGSSAPVAVGILIGEQESESPFNMSSRDASPERPSTKLRKRPTLQTSDSSNTTPSKTPTSSTSRFNFFSSPKSPPKQQTIQLPNDILQNDQLLTLDIQSALFPAGAPNQNDPFSPAAFKNLLMNAEGTLLKLQTAYKLRTLSLHELSAEKSAQEEELEEAEIRAQCFKSQLEDMVHKIADQDKMMEELVNQLAREKQARAEEKEAREKSIALVKANRENTEKRTSCCENHAEEDLGIDRAGFVKKKWRRSAGSTEFSESDTESHGGESVFSRSMSPTLAGSSAASMMTNESTPELLQASFGKVVTVQTQRPKMTQQRSTFEKILSGRDEKEKGEMRGIGLENGCANCQGKEASVAWDTVGLLRAENKGLKDRVGDLEHAVDGALDVCAGLGL